MSQIERKFIVWDCKCFWDYNFRFFFEINVRLFFWIFYLQTSITVKFDNDISNFKLKAKLKTRTKVKMTCSKLWMRRIISKNKFEIRKTFLNLRNRELKRKEKRQTFDLWCDKSYLKRILLFLHHWNHFENFLTNRNENEITKENVVL